MNENDEAVVWYFSILLLFKSSCSHSQLTIILQSSTHLLSTIRGSRCRRLLSMIDRPRKKDAILTLVEKYYNRGT